MWRKYSHSYIIYVCMYACICMCVCMYVHDFPSDGVVRNPPANAGDAEDMGLIPGSERSPGVENGNPLQYSCMNRGTWWATVHGVTKDWAHTHTHTHIYICMYACMVALHIGIWMPHVLKYTSEVVHLKRKPITYFRASLPRRMSHERDTVFSKTYYV